MNLQTFIATVLTALSASGQVVPYTFSDPQTYIGTVQTNAPFNPLSIGGCVLWLNTSSGLYKSEYGTNSVVVTNDVVKYWTDLSGTGSNCTNASATTSYYLPSGGPNGYPSIYVTNSGARLRSKSFTALVVPIWTFCVNYVPSNNTSVILDGQTGSTRMLLQSGATYQIYSGSGLSIGSQPFLGWTLTSYKDNGGSSLMRTNGVQIAAGGSGSQTPTGWNIGTDYTGAFANPWYVSEILVYQANLTTQNITNIEAYLRTKYNLY